jgi:hypothetical protein
MSSLQALQFQYIILIPYILDDYSTSQETHYVSTTKPNRLKLFGETVAVYCENHTEHTVARCGQNAEFQYVKPGGMYTNQ